MEEAKKSKSLSRVPQSLSFDNSALLRTFDNESTIIRDIIVFAGNYKLRNLFHEVPFTIDDFCSEFGYNKTTLQRTMKVFVDNPKLIPIIDGHKFDSLFEYSLYRALKENIIFSRKRDGNESFETVQIIEKLEVLYNKDTGKRTKRRYNIKLGNKILDYLFKEYNLIDYNEYRSIQSTKISLTGAMRNFYIYMGRMVAMVQLQRKRGGAEGYILSIDELCSIFGAEIKDAKHKKEFIKNTLDNLQNELTSLSFNWKLITQNTRYSYFVVFSFPDSTLDYFNEHRRFKFYDKLYNELSKTYAIEKMPSDMLIREKLATISTEEFLNWVTNSSEDMERKEKIYKQIYEEVYHLEYK